MTILLGTIAISFLSASLWVQKTFGDINIEQALWHLGNADLVALGVATDFTTRLIKFIVFFIFLFFILFLAVFLNKKLFLYTTKLIAKIRRKPYAPPQSYPHRTITLVLFLSSLCICIFSLYKVEKQLHVYTFINNNIAKNNFDAISKYYSIPTNTDIIFEKKNNLVIVLAESFENTFSHANGHPYTKQLDTFRALSTHNDNMRNVHGTGWTIAALTGWFFGLPLKPPAGINGNRYISTKGFLPNARSVFDIFRDNGYETVLILGSDKHFSGQDKLFSDHGKFRIFDKAYFKAAGWNLADYAGTGWGFRDSFTLARASEEYARLKAAGKPFVLIVETIDTHSPDGYCPEEHKIYHDIRDAFVETDKHLGAFSEQFFKNTSDNTVYILLGDHAFMGNPEFLPPNTPRTIYNLFYGAIPPLPENKRHEKISALDMAPTILQCAGAKWNNDQFGLGVSLFSSRSSLLQQLGTDKLNSILMGKSALYETFY